MRFLAIAAMAATLPVVALGTASAQSTGTMHGVQHVGAKARCSPGDPNVMVDQKNKTFMLDKSAMSAAMKPGASKSAMGDEAAAGAGAAGMHKMSSGMVSMCKSEAMSMGAKMKAGSMKKSSM